MTMEYPLWICLLSNCLASLNTRLRVCLHIQGIYGMYKQIHVLIWFVKGAKGAWGSANFGKLADKQIFNATLVGSSGRQGLSLCVWACVEVWLNTCSLHFTLSLSPLPPLCLSLSLCSLICWLTHLKSCFWKLPPSPFGNGQTNLVAAKQCKHLNCDTWSPTNLPVWEGSEGSGLGRPRVSHFWPLKSVESRGGIWNCCLPSIVSIVCSSSSQVAALLIITVPPTPLSFSLLLSSYTVCRSSALEFSSVLGRGLLGPNVIFTALQSFLL